jgi:hypothetical protein
METIAEHLKLKYVGKDGDFDAYMIGCHLLTWYELSLIIDYCKENNLYFLIDLNNRRILTKNRTYGTIH